MEEAKKQLILLTGLPGTGKTTIGEALEAKNGFKHFDIELQGKFPDLSSLPDKLVVSWGFVPDHAGSLDMIRSLIALGFKMIWFDGNREASKKAFIKRNTVKISDYKVQIEKIDNSTILKDFDPTTINCFNENGEFKSKKKIISEILSSINTSQ